jgi:hypothetical protein
MPKFGAAAEGLLRDDCRGKSKKESGPKAAHP